MQGVSGFDLVVTLLQNAFKVNYVKEIGDSLSVKMMFRGLVYEIHNIGNIRPLNVHCVRDTQ